MLELPHGLVQLIVLGAGGTAHQQDAVRPTQVLAPYLDLFGPIIGLFPKSFSASNSSLPALSLSLQTFYYPSHGLLIRDLHFA